MRADGDREAGTVLLLTIGLSVVLLLLVAVVVDVSKVVLARRALAGAADGAAVAAAQQADRAAIEREGLGERVPLDPVAVADVVEGYQDEAQGEQPGVDLAGSVDPANPFEALVEARRTITLPLVGWLGTATVDLHAQARASARVTP